LRVIYVILLLLKLVEVEEGLGDSEKYPNYDFKYTSFNTIDAKSPGTIIGNLPFNFILLLHCNNFLVTISQLLDVIGYVLYPS